MIIKNIKVSPAGETLLDLIYPIGSIYISQTSTSPITLVGGNWTALPYGKLLRNRGQSDTSCSNTGGTDTYDWEHEHTMDSHTHTLNGHTHPVAAHNHSQAHTHTIANHRHARGTIHADIFFTTSSGTGIDAGMAVRATTASETSHGFTKWAGNRIAKGFSTGTNSAQTSQLRLEGYLPYAGTKTSGAASSTTSGNSAATTTSANSSNTGSEAFTLDGAGDQFTFMPSYKNWYMWERVS